MHMVQALDANLLSRDPAVCTQFRQDDLCHDTGTLEGLAGMLDRAANLENGSVTMKGETAAGKSIWVAHGTGDGICDFEATKKWTMQAEVQDKEFKEYDGWYHRRRLMTYSPSLTHTKTPQSTFRAIARQGDICGRRDQVDIRKAQLNRSAHFVDEKSNQCPSMRFRRFPTSTALHSRMYLSARPVG